MESNNINKTNKEKKKLNNKQQTVVSIAIAIFVLIAIFCTTKPPKTAENVSPEGYPISRDVFLLDTFCSITVYESGGEQALSDAVDALNNYDDLFNKSKEDSDISRINGRESDTVSISHDTAVMLKAAEDICKESGGSLEPAIKPVTDLWDFKEKKEVPEPELVEKALSKVKSLEWEIDTDNDTFTAYDTDVQIDIGSFAKGFVADKIKEVLVKDGVKSAIINLGGNVLCVGARPDNEPFKIAVKEPDKQESEYSHIVEADDISVVTAGIYERYFEKDGVHYHHIIDPKTGYPVQNGLESVTVYGTESIICDALCTAMFVKGEEEGMKFLDSYNKAHGTDYQAIFLRKE